MPALHSGFSAPKECKLIMLTIYVCRRGTQSINWTSMRFTLRVRQYDRVTPPQPVGSDGGSVRGEGFACGPGDSVACSEHVQSSMG